MKPYLDVNSTRVAYHAEPDLNSVHRSSLLVPTIDGTDVEISFLNHFLIKRNYDHVGCRVTAVDEDGKRIESRLFPVTEPKVYNLPLSRIFGENATGFLVEFFSANNLFIPFPAVMVNHRGDQFVNTIHSFNRVLNDVFEDDEINSLSHPPEASIDVDSDQDIEGFFLFSSGAQEIDDKLTLEWLQSGKVHSASAIVNIPRFSNKLIEYKDVICGLKSLPAEGTLKIHQPRQPMFYSRLFAGRRCSSGTFTANHSYYDSSSVSEYWKNGASAYRSYPFFQELHNRVRFYPIMSASELLIEISIHDIAGDELARIQAGCLKNPGSSFLEANINAIIEDAGLSPESVSSFSVYASPVDGCAPTRINHQLIYGEGLFCSINVSLVSENNFKPKGKTGLTWGQVVAGGASEGFLGIVGNDPKGEAADVEITFYDSDGELSRTVHHMAKGAAILVDLELAIGRTPVAGEDGCGTNYWYVARSLRSDLTAISASRHASQNQVTGEHGF